MYQFSVLVLYCIVFLTSCRPQTHFVKSDNTYNEIMDLTKEDSGVNEIIEPYKKEIGDEMKKVIGQVANMFIKEKPESTLGNWASDLTHSKCEEYLNRKMDFAVLNYGGLRIPSLPKGDVSKGKIFELMPFENYLVLVEMKGSDLPALFDHMALKGGWPVSKHVKMTIHDNKAIDVRINNRKVENDKIYSFATIDYIANGGDNCTFLKDQKKVETGVLFRDAIIEFIEEETKAGRKIDAKLEHRVFILK